MAGQSRAAVQAAAELSETVLKDGRNKNKGQFRKLLEKLDSSE